MKLDDLYTAMPVWAQNLMVTAYGAKLYYERYFNGDAEFLDFLLKNQTRSADEIHAQQVRSLNDLVAHARNNVPLYRSQKQEFDIELKGVGDLARLPILQKETLRGNSDKLLADGMHPKEVITLHTSGTTGKSLGIHVDIASRRKAYAFFSRYHSWAGLKNSKHNVTLGGRTVVPQSKKGKEFWRYNAVMGNYLFSTYHISDANLPYYVDKIRSIAPQFIESYPSAIYLIAKFMEENSLTGIRPKAVMTSGETLFDYQREVVERVLGCRVFDQYGCTEQALFVSQCEMGSYHVHPEYGVVEILDGENRHVEAGQVGRVVCTSFMNRATPLIRYDLGDTAEYGGGRCACGRNFPILNRICGRMDDYIKTPSGRKVGRLDPIFKCVTSTRLAQIVQTDLSHITINIVPGGTYVDDDGRIIVNELRKRVGDDVCIDLRIVEEIKTNKNGKFKSVVSMV